MKRNKKKNRANVLAVKPLRLDTASASTGVTGDRNGSQKISFSHDGFPWKKWVGTSLHFFLKYYNILSPKPSLACPPTIVQQSRKTTGRAQLKTSFGKPTTDTLVEGGYSP